MKAIAALYLLSLLPFCLIGVYRLHMLLRLHRLRRRRASRGARCGVREVPATDRALPRVTVQLPLFNERFVASRLLRAAARLDYPHDRLEIQVLDDSTDDTSEIIHRVAAGLPSSLRIEHLRRPDRAGYKAGALSHGLARARGELIAIFDADFVPEPGFLRRVVREFDDPDVAMVQTRWGHLNAEFSTLTRAQSAWLDVHFAIEHPVRAASGHFFNFNGTAGVWRKSAIDDAGGWQSRTLTEDLDLSYRAQLAGHRFVYRPDVVCAAELPTDVRAFRSQQYRWSRGMTEVAGHVLGSLWRSAYPVGVKIEASVHLLSNLGYVFVCVMSLTLVPTFFIYGPDLSQHLVFQLATAFFTITNFLVVLAFLVTGGRVLGLGWVRSTARAVALLPIGAAIAVAGAEGVFRGLARRPSRFVRTPKNDAVGRIARRGYQQPASAIAVVEALFALYHVVWLGVVVRSGRLDLLPLSLLFLAGYAYFVWCETAGARQALVSVFPGALERRELAPDPRSSKQR